MGTRTSVKFVDFGFYPTLAASLAAENFIEATPIQEASIGHILRGEDIAGLAQTGTGKTAAYLLPLAHRILKAKDASEEDEGKNRFNEWKEGHFVLILVPTRELAEQVSNTIKALLGSCGLQGVPIYGGTSYDFQKKAINRKVEFVVATPGRLIDLFKEHVVDLNQVRAVVFDEADRMFDMGFKDDMKYLLRRIPTERQFLVFSATLNFDVLNVAYEFGSNPIEIDVSRDQAKAENVRDQIFHVGSNDKPRYLLSLLKKYEPQQTIIFSNFKNNVERITNFLNDNGIPAMAISSLLSQAQRNRVMEQFKKQGNNRNILVATDVAARGLDIKGVDLVVNYELPNDAENYVHRIGRTGRAGSEGVALSLVSDLDVEALTRIEEYLGNKLSLGWIEDEELVDEFKKLSEQPQRRNRGTGKKTPQKNFQRSRQNNNSRRSGNRQEHPSGKKRNESSQTRKTGQRSEEGAFHRDRRLGRHKGHQQASAASVGSQRKKNVHGERLETKNKKTSLERTVYKHNARRKKFNPNDYRRSQPSPKGLGGQISHFVKKLFS